MALTCARSLVGVLLLLCQLNGAAETPNLRSKAHIDAQRELDARVLSEYETLTTKNTQLTFQVCNHATKALVFRWPKPGFESGLAHPLLQKTCAVYQREVSRQKLEMDAAILYTQSGQAFGAQAFIADETFLDKLASTWTTVLRVIGLGEPYKQPDMRYDIKVVVSDKAGVLQHDVAWSTEVTAVSLKLVASDEKTRADVAQELGRQPALAPSSRVLSAVEMQKLINPLDAQRAASVFDDGVFVRLEAKPNQPRSAVITIAKPMKRTAAAPLLVLDSDNRIVWILQYTTGSPG